MKLVIPVTSKKSLVEIFGYAADDETDIARRLWSLGACPYIKKGCTKFNHDKSIVYGACSATSSYGDLPICPNRLYGENYETIRKISADAFGEDIPFYLFDEYIECRENFTKGIVALGKNSGKEVSIGSRMSFDWVLAKIQCTEIIECIVVEAQSVDTTGNYRENWLGYQNIKKHPKDYVNPPSTHGLNWANVHKRLIPQIIQKSSVLSGSAIVKNGIYIIIPDILYKKIEAVIGSDIPLLNKAGKDIITVYTYKLGEVVPYGEQRQLCEVRKIRFSKEELTNRFNSGPNLPSGSEFDRAIKLAYGAS